MIYFLFVDPGPLGDIAGSNVFRYISFRTAWSVITALVITYGIFPWFIRWMHQRKVDQIIRSDGPESHLLNKVGTPTMGGVCILIGVSVAGLVWARLDNPAVWMSLAVMLGYGLVGFVDDWKKVMHHSSDGLAGRWKIFWQFVIGGAVLAYGHMTGVLTSELALPFLKGTVIDFAHLWDGAPLWLGWAYPAIGLFIVIGASNAVNLTDGLDGLAIGPVMTSAATYGLLAYLSGNAVFAKYLGIPFVSYGAELTSGELTVIAMALVGAGLGFLWYNAYPAQIFMGDVGSLSLGGVLAMLAILTKHEMLLALVGGIFVLEAVSVILQVGSFKMTGKRIFAMAPIHHHYEKKGWSEPKIIVRFWIISVILALVALSTLKLR
ncbi:MAG: phospho-N-acetylmuramoyl-pentapeptide-transferase [Proteobacteria bacterium]|jgi:phospho-N-acetylmuramoyl-pentapeptide-transferase|nr:phospho-N-acetylmuramoyl-pentapeptide-transferase [Pseudomonadota bacterium]